MKPCDAVAQQAVTMYETAVGQATTHKKWPSRMKPVLLALLAGLLLMGFEVSILRWPAPLHLRMHCFEADLPPGMCTAAQHAADMWHSPALRISIVSAGHEAQGAIMRGTVRDGRMGAGLFVQVGTQRLRRCEILVDPDATPEGWHTDVAPPPEGRYDAITDLAHELGHCLGLMHVEGATPPALMRPLIHRGAYHRALALDDMAGRDALFPSPPRAAGGCGTRRTG